MFKTNGMIAERLFKTFDRDLDGEVSFDEFLDGMSVFYKGSTEERMLMLFSMFDMDNNGSVSREEMRVLLASIVDAGLSHPLSTVTTTITSSISSSSSSTASNSSVGGETKSTDSAPNTNSSSNNNNDAQNGESKSSSSSSSSSTSPHSIPHAPQSSMIQGRSLDDILDEAYVRLRKPPLSPLSYSDFKEIISTSPEISSALAEALRVQFWMPSTGTLVPEGVAKRNSIGGGPSSSSSSSSSSTSSTSSTTSSLSPRGRPSVSGSTGSSIGSPRQGPQRSTTTSNNNTLSPESISLGPSVTTPTQSSSSSSSTSSSSTPSLSSSSSAGNHSSSTPFDSAPDPSPLRPTLPQCSQCHVVYAFCGSCGTFLDPYNNTSSSSSSSSTGTPASPALSSRKPSTSKTPSPSPSSSSSASPTPSHCCPKCGPLSFGKRPGLDYCLICGGRVIHPSSSAFSSPGLGPSSANGLDDFEVVDIGEVQESKSNASSSGSPASLNDAWGSIYLYNHKGFWKWQDRWMLCRQNFLYIFEEAVQFGRSMPRPKTVVFIEGCHINVHDHEIDGYSGIDVVTPYALQDYLADQQARMKKTSYSQYGNSSSSGNNGNGSGAFSPSTSSSSSSSALIDRPPRSGVYSIFFTDKQAQSYWVDLLTKAAKVSKFDDEYTRGKLRGEGKFSKVYECVHKSSGKLFAVKIIDKKESKKSPADLEAIRCEIAILKLVKHPHVISVHAVYDTPDHLHLVMPLTVEDLFERIQRKRYFKEPIARVAVYNLLNAVLYLHSLGIVHRDLKPENILCLDAEDDTNLIIADFGLSQFVGPNEVMQNACGTVNYVAPEVLKMHGYGKNVDVWSIGMIAYVLLYGALPFYNADRNQTMSNILHQELTFRANSPVSREAQDFLKQILVKDPAKRLTVERALRHPWLASVRLSAGQANGGQQT